MHALTILHQELRKLIAGLGTETAKEHPDMGAVTVLRMKLAQASRRRAIVLEETLKEARRNRKPDDVAYLEQVVADLQRARLKSAAHIGKWTMRAIEADWQGYCLDSARMRAAMTQQTDREAQALIGSRRQQAVQAQ